MKFSEIAYKTSTDYEKLYNLLIDGNIIIGYQSVEDSDFFCWLIQMKYNKTVEFFDVGEIAFFKNEISLVQFCELCKKLKIKYIPIN